MQDRNVYLTPGRCAVVVEHDLWQKLQDEMSLEELGLDTARVEFNICNKYGPSWSTKNVGRHGLNGKRNVYSVRAQFSERGMVTRIKEVSPTTSLLHGSRRRGVHHGYPTRCVE